MYAIIKPGEGYGCLRPLSSQSISNCRLRNPGAMNYEFCVNPLEGLVYVEVKGYGDNDELSHRPPTFGHGPFV